MSIAGPAIVAILLVLAALHFYWGAGGNWPGTDRIDLASKVVGTRSRPMPGLWMSVAVTAALAAAAFVVAVSTGLLGGMGVPLPYWTLAEVCVAVVFLARGVAAYVPGVFEYARGTPFYRLNQRYYGPLCLIVAVGILISRL